MVVLFAVAVTCTLLPALLARARSPRGSASLAGEGERPRQGPEQWEELGGSLVMRHP